MGKRRRSFGQVIKAWFRYLDEHSPAEVFGGPTRRVVSSTSVIATRARHLADPFVLSMIAGGALVVGGLAVVGLAWRGAAAELYVALQIAYLVSGGLGGVALVLLGVGMLHIQGLRRLATKESAQMERVTSNAVLLLDAATLIRGSRQW